jgi:hypothetical protein
MQGLLLTKNKKGPFKILINNIFRKPNRSPTHKYERDNNHNRRLTRLLSPMPLSARNSSFVIESS